MKRVSKGQFKRIVFPLCLCLILLFFAREAALRARRERAYLPTVSAAAAEYRVPAAMILAVIDTESDFRPDAVSPAGAVGLMQIMPETFAWMREENMIAAEDGALFDPEVNIRCGACYLSYLFGRFGAWPEALAAYNAGEGRVSEWLSDETLSSNGTLTRIPFPETAAYVEKTLAAYCRYLEKYNK